MAAGPAQPSFGRKFSVPGHVFIDVARLRHDRGVAFVSVAPSPVMVPGKEHPARAAFGDRLDLGQQADIGFPSTPLGHPFGIHVVAQVKDDRYVRLPGCPLRHVVEDRSVWFSGVSDKQNSSPDRLRRRSLSNLCGRHSARAEVRVRVAAGGARDETREDNHTKTQAFPHTRSVVIRSLRGQTARCNATQATHFTVFIIGALGFLRNSRDTSPVCPIDPRGKDSGRTSGRRQPRPNQSAFPRPKAV